MRYATTILVLALSACGGGNGGNATAPVPTPAATPAPPPPPPPPPPSPSPPAPPTPAAAASNVRVETDDYTFAYAYPAVAAGIPALREWLEADSAKSRAEVTRESGQFRREAEKDGFPFRKYEQTTEWKVVTDTPRFLSLSSEGYVYTGGAHGQPVYASVVWDRRTGERLDPASVFASDAAIEGALRPRFCAELNRARERRRGAPVPPNSTDGFDACPKMAEATLLLGSTNRRAIDRVGFILGPYTAGPYAEGAYELTLPVTPALRATVKSAYRDAF